MGMRSTHELVREHEVILGVLAALERRLEDADRTGTVPVEFLREFLAFCRSFVDRCHHAKEEQCLFPCMERRGVAREGGPIGAMLEEHVQGRALVAQIAERLDRYERVAARPADVLASCREYLDLLRGHIDKENHLVLPAGEAVMDRRDDDDTGRCYELQEPTTDDHEQLLEMAERLASRSTRARAPADRQPPRPAPGDSVGNRLRE